MARPHPDKLGHAARTAIHNGAQIAGQSGLKKLKVVATGGLGRLIAQETEAIDIYDSHLTMEGLRILYEKNRKPAS